MAESVSPVECARIPQRPSVPPEELMVPTTRVPASGVDGHALVDAIVLKCARSPQRPSVPPEEL